MRLSIVATLYCSAPFVREFHRRASEAAQRLTDDYEIILVNDGSPDESLTLAVALQATDPHLRVVDLSRNFGHHQAMWVGLAHSQGEIVFLIDSDLEESPEWFDAFERVRLETKADVVFGVQAARAGGWIRRWSGWAFYKLYNAISDVQIPENLLTVRLMSRRYVNALLEHKEVTFTISGLWARTGFHQVAVPCNKRVRGATTYNIFRRINAFVNNITSFSSKPLTFIFYLGMLIVLGSGLFAGLLIVERLFNAQLFPGWTSLMVSIWLIGGLIIFCLGIQGIYLSKIYLEAKHRPMAIVRHVYESADKANPSRREAA
jgi:putative glycosyltransferase